MIHQRSSLAVAVCILLGSASLANAQQATNASLKGTNAALPSTNSSLISLPPVTVVAQAEAVQTGVIEGTDFRNPGGFGPIDSKAATRTFTPNMENPVSVQVIPQEVLKSQQTIYLDEALQNVAGVIPSGSSVVGDSFSIRGFDMHNLTYEDGLRNDNYALGYQQSMQNVENIEVVKGPSSVLYGQAEPGGLVNIDSKKPLQSNYFALNQQIGSFAFYRTTLDATGPLNADKTLLYRFNVDQQNNWSYRDFIHNQRLFLFPTFRWQPNKDNEATLELTYANIQQQYDNGIPFQTNGLPAPVNRGANYAMPWANQSPAQDFKVKFSFTHKFNDDWMLHGAYKTDFQNNPTPYGQYYTGPVDPAGNLPIYAGGTPFYQQWTQEFLTDLTGKFKTWFVKHTALLGFDFYQQSFQYTFQQNNSVSPSFTQNIYAPNWNTPVPGYTSSGSTFQYTRDAAMFAQDQLELPGHLFGLAGFRYDSISIGNSGYSQAASACNVAVTPRFGLLWNPVKPVSIYGSYTANFGASALGALTTNGTVLPPQSAQQWELGLKQESDNKKFTATESIYQLTKQNVPQADPSNPLFSEAVGQIRSKGVEVQVAGEIVSGWKVIAAYSYISAVVTQGSTAGSYGTGSQVGQRPTGVPYNSGSVWNTYEIQQGPLKRLRLGAGVVYRSQEVAYVPNSSGSGYDMEQIPSFATVNLMAAYPFQVGPTKWTAQVNIENLFNSYYFTTINPYQAMPGAPVNFMASLKAEF